MQADPIAAIEQRRPRPTASLRRLVCCGAGGIAVEFALLLPVLVFTMIGLYDFARVVGEDGRITSAALAGVHYGMQDTAHAADTPGIIQAVRRDAKDSASDLSVTTQQTCTCGDGAQTSCASLCATIGKPIMHVRVQVSRSFRTMVAYPFVANPIALTREASVRVQ